jgi:ribokinase
MPNTPKIVVVGSFVVGITFGVPRLPVLGETLMGDAFDLGAGGKGTNQAIGATRLGADVHLLACVGDDLFADMAFDIYRREGMALTHLQRMSGIHTGVGVVTLLPSGENWIVADYGANLRMTPAHVDAAEDLIAQSDIVLTQGEAPLETVAHAMHLGRKHGAMTIWNPAPAKPVSADLLANVDLLTPNETETRILLGLPPDDPTPTQELARHLLSFGIQQIVVTKGKQGALIVTPDQCEELPAIPVEVIDPTGCGDCFNAALAVGLGQGMALAEAARQATYAGAYMATHLGVIDGLPTRAQLDKFVASHHA